MTQFIIFVRWDLERNQCGRAEETDSEGKEHSLLCMLHAFFVVLNLSYFVSIVCFYFVFSSFCFLLSSFCQYQIHSMFNILKKTRDRFNRLSSCHGGDEDEGFLYFLEIDQSHPSRLVLWCDLLRLRRQRTSGS